MLNLISKDNYIIKVQSQEQAKVQAKTIEAYDVIIKALKEKIRNIILTRKNKRNPSE